MSVAVVPKRDPALEGVRAAYEIDETLEAECTSAPSYPPASLTFILNDKEVRRLSSSSFLIFQFSFYR